MRFDCNTMHKYKSKVIIDTFEVEFKAKQPPSEAIFDAVNLYIFSVEWM